MLQHGVVSLVEEASDWCAPRVVVAKPSGGVRLCVDFTQLNNKIVRERFVMTTVEEAFAQLV